MQKILKNYKHQVSVISIFLLAVFFYLTALEGEFVFDDIPLLSSDPFYHESANSSLLDCFKRTYWRKEFSIDLYRPITTASLLLNAKIAGLYSPSFRFVNICLNASICALIYFLSLRLSKNFKISILSALFFAIHPLHSEAVIPASGRADLLCALFVFSGFLFYISNSSHLNTILTFVCSILAIFSKENGIILPPLCLLYYLFYICDFRKIHKIQQFNNILSLLLIFLSIPIYFLIRIYVFGSALPKFPAQTLISDNPLINAQQPWRLLSAVWLQFYALLKTIFPAHLSHDYSYAQILPINSISDPRLIYLILSTSTLLSIILFFLKNKNAFPLFLICAYSISVLPVSNIFILSGTIFGERLYYLPSFFVILLIINEFYTLISKKIIRSSFITIITICIISAFYIRLYMRIEDWKDPFSIAHAGIRTSPLSHKVWNNYGLQLLDRGLLNEAENCFSRSIEIFPQNLQALRNRAYLKIQQQRLNDAIPDLLKCIELGTKDTNVYNKLGAILATKGHLEEAKKFWLKSLQINPDQKNIIELVDEIQ